MINDIADLIKIQSKNIEHYNKYPIALLLFVMLILEVPSSFLSEGNESSIAFDLLDFDLPIKSKEALISHDALLPL